MASTSIYVSQPALSSVAAANIYGPPQRSNSPAVGGRRKAAVPTKAAPVVVAPPASSAPKVTGDIFYGYEDLSKMCGRFIERFPAARGSSGHRLFISAFMIASKVVCDDTYSNKSWCIVGQNLYTLKEVNQMEREMCSYLEWILHVEAAELEAFTQRVKKEYGAECGPNPPQWVSTPAVPTSSSSSSTVVAPLVSPVESSSAATRPTVVPTAPAQSYPSPRSSPPTPVTSNTASPASSDSDECPTPPSGEDQAAIAASTHAPTDTTIKAKHIHQSSGHVGIASSDPSFAFAGPTVW